MATGEGPNDCVHIHLRGIVQGVGFRPLVHRLAQSAGLSGNVSNGADGVHIRLACPEAQGRAFLHRVLEALPPWAEVSDHSLWMERGGTCEGFRIVTSDTRGEPDLLLTPDRNPCPDCRAEIRDPANRRHAYPFTTCLHCGPRYGIVTGMPYDRERTTMAPFAECPRCRSEYLDPEDRRFHAQTNSCPDCRIPLRWTDARDRPLPGAQEDIPRLAAETLDQGFIVAVKGHGGFLLLADARNEATIDALRRRKHRPAKPLALMYPDLERLAQDLIVGAAEIDALSSPAGPIVLLEPRPDAAERLAIERIAPGLRQLGAMLPSTPLLDLILLHLGRPVVATSGNLSGGAILHRDEEALAGLGAVADRFLSIPREIATPQDDSVIRFLPGDPHPIILRRSRGMAPALVPGGLPRGEETLLALGAHMKACIAVLHRGNTHISPYLGHLEGYETQERFQAVTLQLLELLGARPDRILVDAHPGYFSHQWGLQLGEAWGVPVEACFHHEAHLAALLAEHDLLDDPHPTLGLVWDGTGLGEDGSIWGGEFLLRREGRTERTAHFAEFPVLMGDKMAREPRLSALSIAAGHEELAERLRPLFTGQEWRLYTRRRDQGGILRTSSAGRLFDAVAALLGLGAVSRYEGESAMRLETLAWEAPETPAWNLAPPATGGPIATAPLFGQLAADLHASRPLPEIAAAFHRSLAAMAAAQARRLRVRSVGLSGGVWQNAFLTRCALDALSGDFEVLRHRRLSPNDENIAYGQLALCAGQVPATLEAHSHPHAKPSDHVPGHTR